MAQQRSDDDKNNLESTSVTDATDIDILQLPLDKTQGIGSRKGDRPASSIHWRPGWCPEIR